VRMNTPLQNVDLTTNEIASSMVEADTQEQGAGEVAHHIHMPNPSLWPLMAAIAVLLTMVFLLALNSAPWLLLVGGVLVLIGILGWGLEDPFAPRGVSSVKRLPMTYEEAAETGRPTPLAERVLESAQDVADQTVTVRSTEWSAHPVKVEIEQEGVVLALYGKVELEAQRKELEERLLHMPGVIDVKNFIVAEDTILNAINARIEKLKADGKLQGAKNIQVLVENYIVHLYGETPTPQMKYLLERELVGIPGVRVVVNHIGLNEDIPGNLGRTKNR
jgi:BON domain